MISWTFDTDSESWTETSPTFGWDGSNGSPAPGCLKGVTSGVCAIELGSVAIPVTLDEAVSMQVRFTGVANIVLQFQLIGGAGVDQVIGETRSNGGDTGWYQLNGVVGATQTVSTFSIVFTADAPAACYVDTIIITSNNFSLTYSADGIPGAILVTT